MKKNVLQVITRMLSILIEQTQEFSYLNLSASDGTDVDKAVNFLRQAKVLLDEVYDNLRFE